MSWETVALVGILATFAGVIYWLQDGIHAREMLTAREGHDHELGVMAEAYRAVESANARATIAMREEAAEWSHLMRHTTEESLAALAIAQAELMREREQWARLLVSANDPVNYGVLAQKSRISPEDLGQAELHRLEVQAMRARVPGTGFGQPAPAFVDGSGEAVIPVGAG